MGGWVNLCEVPPNHLSSDGNRVYAVRIRLYKTRDRLSKELRYYVTFTDLDGAIYTSNEILSIYAYRTLNFNFVFTRYLSHNIIYLSKIFFVIQSKIFCTNLVCI